MKRKRLLKTPGKNCIVDLGFPKYTEIDFIAGKPDDKLYIRLAESSRSADTRERELRPLRMIPNNYEKSVLSMDRNYISSRLYSASLIYTQRNMALRKWFYSAPVQEWISKGQVMLVWHQRSAILSVLPQM